MSKAVESERERIRRITSLPQAAAQPQAALAVALAGASVNEARAALTVAATLNGETNATEAGHVGGNPQAERLILALADTRRAANEANAAVQKLRSSWTDAVCNGDELAAARAKRALAAAREELADQTEKEALLEEEMAALGLRRLPLDAPTLARLFGSVPQRRSTTSKSEAP